MLKLPLLAIFYIFMGSASGGHAFLHPAATPLVKTLVVETSCEQACREADDIILHFYKPDSLFRKENSGIRETTYYFHVNYPNRFAQMVELVKGIPGCKVHPR